MLILGRQRVVMHMQEMGDSQFPRDNSQAEIKTVLLHLRLGILGGPDLERLG